MSHLRFVIVTGWTGAGKSTIADALAADIGATVASFDWIMSGLRAFPELWPSIETPVERQREIGWSLLSRVAEQQLRRDASCVLDLVAREKPREQWQALATRYNASFHVIECICSDIGIHKKRLEDRNRTIPDWYEVSWVNSLQGRETYSALRQPKLVLDAVSTVREFSAGARILGSQVCRVRTRKEAACPY
jgi:predicted kinase